MVKINVDIGDKVRKGQTLGIGSSGAECAVEGHCLRGAIRNCQAVNITERYVLLVLAAARVASKCRKSHEK